MSISNLLVPNNYDLFGKSLTIDSLNLSPINDFQQWIGVLPILPITSGFNIAVGTGSLVFGNVSATPGLQVASANLSPIIQTATNKGFKLNSINVAYQVITQALISASIVLYQHSLINGSPLSTSVIPITNNLVTTITGANIHYINVPINNPIYAQSNTFYSLEFNFDTDALTELNLYGAMLNFTRNDY